MIRELGVFAFLLFFITECQFSGKQEAVQAPDNVYQVDIVSTIENKSEMYLSDIASEVSYIPLETNANNLIRNIQKVVFTDNFIFVSDVDGLYQFTAKGKYLKRIGNKGRGPGEYLSILNFIVNERANIVLVMGEYSTIEYDMEGNFVKNFKRVPGIQFEFIEQDRIVFYKPNSINSPVNLIITSLDLIPIRKFYNPSPKPSNDFTRQHAPLYNFNGHIYFKEHWNDTLFCINDSVRVPHIIFNEKDVLLDKSFELKSNSSVPDLISQLDKIEDKLMTSNIFESDRFVLISYSQGMNSRVQKYVRILFDKKNNNTFRINKGEFTNDIDGGIDFFPKQIVDSRVLIQWLDVFNLKAYTATVDFATSAPKYPSKKKELEKLSSNLKDNDNPVLMLLKLKE